MTDDQEQMPNLSTPGPVKEQTTGPAGQHRSLGRPVRLLIGLCLLVALGLAAVAALDALSNSPALARATPTPAFLVGMDVRLVAPENGPVTVWQVAGQCELGLAFGQVPSGSEARTAEGFCYNRKLKSAYQRIVLSPGSGGWVAVTDLISPSAYTPPTPTATVEPTPGPTELPTPTAPPTATPVPAPLPPGSTLTAGNWAVRIDRGELADAVTSAAGDQSVQPSGRFALIYLSVTNTGVQPAALHASRVLIQDAAGGEYRNNDLASAYVSSPGCADFVLDLPTGASACLVAAVDIPAQGGSYTLSLTGASDWLMLDLPQ